MITGPLILKGLGLCSIPAAVVGLGLLLNQQQPNIKTYLVSYSNRSTYSHNGASDSSQPTQELYTDALQTPLIKTAAQPSTPTNTTTKKQKNYTCFIDGLYQDDSCTLKKLSARSDSKDLTFEDIPKNSTTPVKADLSSHNWFVVTMDLNAKYRQTQADPEFIRIESANRNESNLLYGYLKVEARLKSTAFSGNTDTFVGKVDLSTATQSIGTSDNSQKHKLQCKFKILPDTQYMPCDIFKFAQTSVITDFKTTTKATANVTKIPDNTTTELTKDYHYIIKLGYQVAFEAIKPTTIFTLKVTKDDNSTELVDFTIAAILTKSFSDTNKKATVLKYF